MFHTPEYNILVNKLSIFIFFKEHIVSKESIIINYAKKTGDFHKLLKKRIDLIQIYVLAKNVHAMLCET